MKTVYIPKGETVKYDSLYTEALVVDGCLYVSGDIKATNVSGRGFISADTISADNIRIGELEAVTITCESLIAKRVQTSELFASESVVASCFLAAETVQAGKLTVSVSEIGKANAEEIINLVPKRRSLFGTLVASALRSLWTRLTAPEFAEPTPVQEEVHDAPYRTADDTEELVIEEVPYSVTATDEPFDEELNRFVAMFKLARESGFTLRIIPGTPEENAPVFDFETQQIVHPAA